MTVKWNNITARVMPGETKLKAMNRKVKTVHGKKHFLHQDSFKDDGGPYYRLAWSDKHGTHLHGRMFAIKEV